MAFCKKCGNQLAPGAVACPKCGTRVAAENSTSGIDFSDKLNEFTNTKDSTSSFDPNDIAANKVMAVLAYIGWLVLIPLLAAKNSPYARYHTNQGLVLALIELAFAVAKTILVAVISMIFAPLAAILNTILGLVNLAFLAFAIFGIVNAANGKAKELPIIGNIILIK